MDELAATSIDSNQHFSLQIRALSSVRFQKIHGNRTNFKNRWNCKRFIPKRKQQIFIAKNLPQTLLFQWVSI